MDEIYSTYDCYAAYVQSIELKGITAAEQSKAFMENIRANTPTAVGGATVTATIDYKTGVRRVTNSGAETPTGLPASNVVTLELGNAGKVILRPSGTEPKIKLYYTAVGKTWPDANSRLEKFRETMSAFLPD
jgi:phosphoglucomutase